MFAGRAEGLVAFGGVALSHAFGGGLLLAVATRRDADFAGEGAGEVLVVEEAAGSGDGVELIAGGEQ